MAILKQLTSAVFCLKQHLSRLRKELKKLRRGNENNKQICSAAKLRERRKVKAWQCSPIEGRTFYAVWDAIGDGRLVGVFSSFEMAEKIRLINPHYYRHYKCHLNQPTDLAIAWLEEPERSKLIDTAALTDNSRSLS